MKRVTATGVPGTENEPLILLTCPNGVSDSLYEKIFLIGDNVGSGNGRKKSKNDGNVFAGFSRGMGYISLHNIISL